MRFSTSTLGANYHFQPKSVVDPNHLGNVLTVVSDKKIAVSSGPQDWLDEFTNNDALNQAGAWSPVAAPLNTKSIDTDRLKFTSSNVGVGLGKAFSTPAATGTNYQISFDLDKGSCTQIKIEVFTAPAQSPAAYSNIVSASGTYVIPFTDLSAVAWMEVTKIADNGVVQSFYLDNIKLNNLTNPSQQVAYFTPEILSATDYYAFGAPMNGRQFNSNSYKYGFNGKENDLETGTQDYGFRIYNPALGKFLSIDPVTSNYPMLTPYQFGSNRPIDGIDFDGLEWQKYRGWTEDYDKAGVLAIGVNVMANTVLGAVNAVAGIVMGTKDAAVYTYKASQGKVNVLNDIKSTYNGVSSNLKTFSGKPIKEQARLTGRALSSPEFYGAAIGFFSLGGGSNFFKGGAVTEGGAIFQTLKTENVLFSQSSVNGVEEIAQSMKSSGWVGSPIDVVQIGEKTYGTLDNTRVLAAHQAGIDVKAVVHQATDLLTEGEAARFSTKAGIPKTWGEAYLQRIQKQSAAFKKTNPQGSYTTGTK